MHDVTIRKKAMISQPMIVITNLTAEQLKIRRMWRSEEYTTESLNGVIR